MKNIVLYDCQANHGEKTLHCGAKVQILDKSKFKGINFSLTKGSSTEQVHTRTGKRDQQHSNLVTYRSTQLFIVY